MSSKSLISEANLHFPFLKNRLSLSTARRFIFYMGDYTAAYHQGARETPDIRSDSTCSQPGSPHAAAERANTNVFNLLLYTLI